MLHLQLNTNTGVPVYRQVMEQIRFYAASGVIRNGDQLPSIRELALSLHVNPTTIVKAYTELEHEKVIEMRHGKGAFLTQGAHPLSQAEVDESLRAAARPLAVQAAQMGANQETVLRIVREELGKLDPGTRDQVATPAQGAGPLQG